ncbi:uncharacterized protein LOC110239317 [Exaiptasia diaphana]|uniref:Uncharacterized protein n=1 Tax=Exaiptasia diaphana TaxID=2652724 RepID=A0A913X9X3_EXADI|nr:uncharacterized protein LOC110239317 [Exaiptasia diaphana]
MKIICAGLPKTGTKSIAAALRILGFTVHDFEEHLEYHMDQYIEAMHGRIPDFKAMYSNVDATTDIHSCFFWKEIKTSFPNSKVILMERDSVDLWVKSIQHTQILFEQTFVSLLWMRLGFVITPTGRKWKEFSRQFVKRMEFFNEQKLPTLYNEHNARVKNEIPRDDLLIYNIKQGWEPLCEFLDLEVPDVQFPCINVKSAKIPVIMKNSAVSNRIFYELICISVILTVLVSVLIVMIFK